MTKLLRAVYLYYLARLLAIPFIIAVAGVSTWLGLDSVLGFWAVPLAALGVFIALLAVYVRQRRI
jgi:hypothetical protein